MEHGRVGIGELVGGHQVDARKVLVCGVNPLQVFARHIHEDGQSGAVGNEHGVETLAQFGQCVGASDDHVALDLHAGALQPLDFLRNNFFGEPELRDAVHQHAAGFVQRFIDRDVVSHADQFAGGGESRRTGPDDGHALAGGGRLGGRQLIGMIARPVGNVTFEVADSHRRALVAAHADDFTLRLLRADPTGDGWQGVVAKEALCGLADLAFRNQADEARDVDVHRAARHAARVFALETAVGFQQGELLRETEVDFLEVGGAGGGSLFGHLLPVDLQALLGGDFARHKKRQ